MELYVMFATLVGVVIAILLGFAGLAVAPHQTWIAYQQSYEPGIWVIIPIDGGLC